ncbi:enoyl-CoA hydratase/isomerase family protein [Schumannella luteola]
MSLAGAPGLELRQEGPVIVATLDAPDGNTMSLAMCDALAAVLVDPPSDAHVLVLEARGDAFCVGRERVATTAADLAIEVGRLTALNAAFGSTRLVTVAKVQGSAAGFGVGLAALCDVAIALRSAEFWFPEVGLGLAPTLVLAWLPAIVGRREAFWLTATGERIDGARAARIGLINDAVDDRAELDAEVASRVAALTSRSSTVHSDIRAMLRVTHPLADEATTAIAADRLVLGSIRRAGG